MRKWVELGRWASALAGHGGPLLAGTMGMGSTTAAMEREASIGWLGCMLDGPTWHVSRFGVSRGIMTM